MNKRFLILTLVIKVVFSDANHSALSILLLKQILSKY